MSTRRDLPVEDSWRVVEGEHDSFDTTILPSLDDEDVFIPRSSGQTSSAYPSQQFSQGNTSFASQDSISDFVNHGEDEQVILREPFRPSVSRVNMKNTLRPREPEFKMPLVDVDSDSMSIDLRSRTVSRGNYSNGSPRRGRTGYDRRRISEDNSKRHRMNGRSGNSLPGVLFDVLLWSLGVVGMAFRYAQRPLAILLAIYLSFGAMIIAQNMVKDSVTASLSPICRLPGSSLLNLPFCPSADSIIPDDTHQSVEFDDLMGVQSKFEQVLEKSADGVSLPFEMKRSETTIRDLRSLVRHSDIQSRDELVFEFDGYIDTARQTASDLQKFNTHVGSAVDAVISINRWTSRYIDSLAPDSEEQPSSLIGTWAGWLFYPFQPTDAAFNEQVLLDKYIEHTALVSDRIATLILEAQSVLRLLTRAEDHLSLIYDITTRSSANVASRREQVFWNIWTLVGANSARLHNLSQQLALLKAVDSQRSTAVAQVSALILELEGIQAGLGDLRDRVAEPELLRAGSVTEGARIKMIPLSVHIETIDRGVERLEDARKRIRAAENERVRDALSHGGMRNEKLIDSK